MAETPKPTAPTPRPIRPKYQVFISSTFGDLYEERKAVTWEILKLGEIPTGMENFSAEPDRGWKVIQRTIDRSDYYILLLAGRYGSLFENTDVSWTEREYDYAIGQGVPVIAFIREAGSITSDKMAMGEDHRRLEAFKAKVRNNHLYEPWNTEADLRARVAVAIPKRIREDEEEGTPRPGWYRGGQGASPAAMEEMARLSSENHEFRLENDRLKALVTAAKEEATFEINVLDSAGNPLPEVTFTRVIRWSPQLAAGAYPTHNFEKTITATLMAQSTQVAFNKTVDEYLTQNGKLGKIQDYTLAKALRNCTQLTFSIRNTSGPTATDVRCDIQFPDGFTLHCGPLPEAVLPYDLPRRPDKSLAEEDYVQMARAQMLIAPVRTRSSFSISSEGKTLQVRAGKVQHENTVKFASSDDIVTVLPSAGAPREGELSYRIWSDSTKPREGRIPFRIIRPTD